MTYDDDELAEAALLLAHTDPTVAMPRDLERKIMARGRDVAAEVRFTTTKTAVMSLVAEPAPAPRRASPLRTWGGWLAAAACVAVFVYQWRVHDIERAAAGGAKPAVSVSARAPIALKISAGVAVAEVTWDAASLSGQANIASLEANARGERYVIWLSESDDAHAIAVGSFGRDVACRDKVFALHAPPSLATVRAVWITRSAVTAVDSSPRENADHIVGEGRSAER